MAVLEGLGGAVDPRVRRTRLMLFEALQQLVREKDFERVSVQDIAEKAALNRATFYDHYPDKFALLEAMIGERLESLVAKRGLRFDNCEGAVKGMALIVCDFLTDIPCGGRNERSQLEMHVQMAVIATIKAIIRDGVERHGEADERTAALVSTAAAWAICGAANEWAQTPDRCPVEEIAEAIERLVAPLFKSLDALVAS